MELRTNHGVEMATSRRFQCHQCPKRYTKLEHLNRHERTHSNSKPFQCRRCGKSFGRQDVLGRHMRLHASQSSSQFQPARQDNRGFQHSQDQSIAQGHSSVVPDCLSQTDPLTQANLPDPQGLFESDNLLEWLMSDTYGGSLVPLPLLDLPGTSTISDTFNFAFNLPTPDHLDVQENQGPGNLALHQIYKLIDDLSKKLNSDVHLSAFTSSFLDVCLHEYFKRVAPGFPVIHEQTFSLQRSIPTLLLNMVALGSLFVCEKGAVEKGEMLWRLGHMAVATSWQTLIGMRGPYDACDGIQLVLTALLGQTYALLSSSASVRTTASVFHGLGFYWARNSGMYMIQDILADGIPTLDMPEADKNTVWRKWAATEVQRRVILGHYILDGLISQASGSPASARHLINSIDTACSDTVFAAKTADAWILETTRSSRVQMPMSEAFYRVCSPGYSTNPTYLSQFSIFVIIEGLQSLIADLHEVRGHVFGTVSRQEVVRAMLNIFQGNIITMSQPRSVHHLHLLIRWHCIFIEATAPSISIYRWMCNRYQLPQTLGGIHAKSRLEQFDVNHWAEKADAFRAVLHAISITRLLDDLPLNQAYTMHIPTAVFTSAMVIVTMCLLKQSIIEIPENYTWTDVWASQLDDEHESLDHGLALEELMRKLNPDDKVPMVPIHLLDEINSLQHILKTVASRWGVSAQMEDLISRLAVIARERRATSF